MRKLHIPAATLALALMGGAAALINIDRGMSRALAGGNLLLEDDDHL